MDGYTRAEHDADMTMECACDDCRGMGPPEELRGVPGPAPTYGPINREAWAATMARCDPNRSTEGPDLYRWHDPESPTGFIQYAVPSTPQNQPDKEVTT